MKDLSNFRAPYLDKRVIREKADEFREKYGKGIVPVDIEDIIEFDLGFEIKAKWGLYSACNTNAFLASDCKSIFVDHSQYLDRRQLPAFRFSLAHEIGHFVLHRDIISLIRATSIPEWKQAMMIMPEEQYGYVELHAFEFAGRLLVPPDLLIEELRAQKESIELFYKNYPDFPDDAVIEHVASRICKRFDVSAAVIERRIKFEAVWENVRPKV